MGLCVTDNQLQRNHAPHEAAQGAQVNCDHAVSWGLFQSCQAVCCLLPQRVACNTAFLCFPGEAGRSSNSSMADEASGENRPVPKQEGQIINLIVKDQMGAEVHFKVKSHTKLEKVSLLWLPCCISIAWCCTTTHQPFRSAGSCW